MAPEGPSDKWILTDQQVRRVIGLATHMPPSTEGISIAELRQIARELDIDDDAFERALNAVMSSESLPPPAPSWLSSRALQVGRVIDSILPQRARLLALGAVGGFSGWLDAYADSLLRGVINGETIMHGSTSYLVVRLSILLSLITLANSLSRRLKGNRNRYLAETVATWGSLAAAWSLTTGYVTTDLLQFVAISIVGFGLWGWLIIRPEAPADGLAVRAHPAEPLSNKPTSQDQTGTRFDLMSPPHSREPVSRLRLSLFLKTLVARGTT